MFTTSRSIDEITYIIDTTLTDLVKLKHRFISEESKLTWLVSTTDVDDTLNKLKEVSELLDDPLLVQNYSHYLKKAKERIDSFNDDTSYYHHLLTHSEDLSKLIADKISALSKTEVFKHGINKEIIATIIYNHIKDQK
jgi:lysyl-tRNA synthetase class I